MPIIQPFSNRLRGHLHGNTFVCKCTFRIILDDHPHGSCKHTLLNPGLGGKIWKRCPCVLVWTANPHTLRIDDANNGGLHACVCLSGLLGQNILLLCHYAERKRIMDHQLDIFIFFFLCSLSPSTVCLCTVQKLYAHALSLRLRYWWIQVAAIGLEYELQHVESFTMDPFRCKYSWNDAEEDGEKRLFWYVWT